MFSAVIFRIFVIATTSSRSVTATAGRGGGAASAGAGGAGGASAGRDATVPEDAATAVDAAPATFRFSRNESTSFLVTRL
jgi:hypothetical protein